MRIILISSLNLSSSLMLATLSSSTFTTIPSLSSPTLPLEDLRTLSASSLTTISSLSSPTSPQDNLPTLSPSTSTTSFGSPTQTLGVKTLPQPSNDCEAIGPQYTAELREERFLRDGITNTVFEIYCKTDLNVGAFMSFYSPSITTCIDGCAAYNAWQIYHNYPRGLNCSGVTYGIKRAGYGNCILKAPGIIAAPFESADWAYAKLKT